MYGDCKPYIMLNNSALELKSSVSKRMIGLISQCLILSRQLSVKKLGML